MRKKIEAKKKIRASDLQERSDKGGRSPWVCNIYLVSLGGPLSLAHGQAAHGGGGGAEEGRLGGLPRDWSWRVSTKDVLM